MKKLILFGLLITAALMLAGCASQQPEGLPAPAGSDAAIAGQGFATGTYDREDQLYNRIFSDGTLDVSLVENGNWFSLGRLNAGSSASRGDLRLTAWLFQVPVLTSLRLDSSVCSSYKVDFDDRGRYTVFRISGTGVQEISVPVDSFIVNRRQSIRQIPGTDDAITIHLSTSRSSWFTLHCDRS